MTLREMFASARRVYSPLSFLDQMHHHFAAFVPFLSLQIRKHRLET